MAWRARLEDHLGTYSCELTGATAALMLDHPMRLAGLSAACAVIERALPEREPHADLYRRFKDLIGHLEAEDGPRRGCGAMSPGAGFAGRVGVRARSRACAATGEVENLAYVSPKSGAAVSAAAGRPYRGKLLALPEFLGGSGLAVAENSIATPISQGLALTGYFLERHIFSHHRTGGPAARTRLVDRVRQMDTISSG